MKKTKILRVVLLIAATFNFTAPAMSPLPATIGKIAELPEPGSIFYSLMLSLPAGLFGAVYAWLAFQKQINKPCSVFRPLEKPAFFCISLLAVSRALLLNGFSVAIGDLIFALIFFWWLIPNPETEA